MFSWFQVDPVERTPRGGFARLLALFLAMLAVGSIVLIVVAVLQST